MRQAVGEYALEQIDIHAQWQVGAMLLAGGHGQDRNGAGCIEPGEIRTFQVGPIAGQFGTHGA